MRVLVTGASGGLALFVIRALWEEAGADVTFVAFEGGHEIPPPVVEEAERFLAAALAAR